jgi:hypothetical protein
VNDPFDYVRLLAETARLEKAPEGHVAMRVLARVRLARTPPLVRPWSLFAAGAFALATVAACSLFIGYSNQPDPMVTLFKMASLNL